MSAHSFHSSAPPFVRYGELMSTMTFPSDIEIAQRVEMRPIEDVAAELGLGRDDLDL